MNRIVRGFVGVVAAIALVGGVAGCSSDSYQEIQKRQEQSKQSASVDTLEKKNLRAKKKLEEDPNRVGYVYLLSFGKPYGYYTVKGKVSSSGSQIEPEDQILHPYSGEYIAVDGPKDDGTYGEGDPGIFFFTTDGVFVETSTDYFYATQPIATGLEVPKLG